MPSVQRANAALTSLSSPSSSISLVVLYARVKWRMVRGLRGGCDGLLPPASSPSAGDTSIVTSSNTFRPPRCSDAQFARPAATLHLSAVMLVVRPVVWRFCLLCIGGRRRIDLDANLAQARANCKRVRARAAQGCIQPSLSRVPSQPLSTFSRNEDDRSSGCFLEAWSASCKAGARSGLPWRSLATRPRARLGSNPFASVWNRSSARVSGAATDALHDRRTRRICRRARHPACGRAFAPVGRPVWLCETHKCMHCPHPNPRPWYSSGAAAGLLRARKSPSSCSNSSLHT